MSLEHITSGHQNTNEARITAENAPLNPSWDSTLFTLEQRRN